MSFFDDFHPLFLFCFGMILLLMGVAIAFSVYHNVTCDREEFVVTGIKGVYRGTVIYETDKGDITDDIGYRTGSVIERCVR